MSRSYDISIKIADRLSQITVANGFQTDIGLHVLRGRRRIDPEQVPCVVLIEGEDDVLSDSLKNAHIDQKYYIEGHDACDPDNPNDKAHLVIADIKKAIFSGDLTLDKTVRNITYKGRNILPREEAVTFVTGSVRIGVQFVEDLLAP